MLATMRPLLASVASELMNPTLVSIPEEMSLQAAAHELAQAHVSGAPVVDARGRCVGVLSAQDFVTWAEKGSRPTDRRQETRDCFCSAWHIPEAETLPEDAVCHYMTRDPVTAVPSTPIGTLAQMMVDAHIHRIVIVDRGGRPVGIVSSTDVVAAVARAARRDSDVV
jgi:CBS domain-containing protein